MQFMKWKGELDFACKIALNAGKILKESKQSDIIDNSGRDVKHSADLNSERYILSEISKSKYTYPILSEEKGKIGNFKINRPKWIIDPLDGTVNFSRGIDYCCVSIAIWDENPILGVVYDFFRDELFYGIVGEGAWLNGNRISPSKIKDKNRAILATGFPVNRDFSSLSLIQFLDNIKSYKKIRLLGSAALSLSYVACGRVDGYWEDDIMFWDIAGGIAIIKSASGYVERSLSAIKKLAFNVCAGDVFKTID